MKHFTQNLRWLLMSLLLVVGGSAWAESETIQFSAWTPTLENGVQYTDPFVKGDVSVTFSGGANDGKYYTTGTGIRTYGNGSITVSAGSNNITKIVFTFNGASYAPGSDATWDPSTGTVNAGATTIWEGSSTSVKVTRPSGTGHWRLQKVEVTYEAAASNKVAKPSFSPEGGSFPTSQVVTISSTTEGATIMYSTDGGSTWNNYTTALTISETTTIQAKATKTGLDDSDVATATFTKATIMTVAEAIAAIDAGSGTTGVYATGIVSKIVTPYNSQYGNISFNISADGTESSAQLQAFRCFGIDGALFTSENDVQVGDIVVVYGNLKKYNSTYEFDQNCHLASLVRPEQAISFDESSYTGTIGTSFTAPMLNNPNNLSVTYTSVNENVATVNPSNGAITLVAAGATTITATAGEQNAHYKLFVIDPNNGTEANPYSIEDAIAYIGRLGTEISPVDIYVSGIVSEHKGFNSDNSITYFISDNGLTTIQMKVYKGKGLDGADFTGPDDLAVGDLVTVCGKVKMYNTTPEFDSGSKLISHTQSTDTRLELFLNEFYQDDIDNTIPAGSTITITVGETPEFTRAYPTLENGVGVRLTQGEIVYTGDNDALGTVDAESGVITLVSGATGTLKVTATFEGNETYKGFTGYYYLTVNPAQVTPADGDYVKVTSDSDLEDGEYLIVYEEGGLAFNGALETLDATSNTIEVTIINNTIASSEAVDAATFTIESTTDGYSIKSASGYYIGQTSDANGLKTDAETEYTNAITIDSDGNANIVASGAPYLRYNATSGQERFRYFKSSTYTSQKPIALFKKNTAPDTRIATTVTLDPETASYNVVLGDDFTAPTATLDPAVSGATLTYESSDPTVATVAADGTVTILAAGTTTITAKFAGNDEYKPSQATYTINVTAPAVVITSLQQLQEVTTSTSATDVTLQLTDIYVTALKGTNNAYLSDGTYGALVYGAGHGLEAGKMFSMSSPVTMKTQLFRGATELTQFDATSLTITDGTLAPQTKTIDEITVANQSLPVKLENVTYDAVNTQFSDGTNTIKYYDNFSVNPTLEDGHVYDITGIIVMYNNLQIAPLAAENVVDVTPAVAVEAPTFDPAGGTYDADQNVTITCATEGATIYYTLDGTDPTTESTEYTSAIVITATTTLKAIASDGTNTSAIATATYTINKVEAPYAKGINSDYFVKVTSLDQLENGDAVIILNESADMAMSTQQNSNNRPAKPETIIPWSADEFYVANTAETTQKFTLVKVGENYYFYANHGNAQGYLYAASATSNQMRTKASADDNAKAVIELDNGDATITFQGENTRNILRFNANNNIFNCYNSNSSIKDPVQIYVEVERPTDLKTVTLTEATDCYKTIVAPYNLDLSASDLKAYIVTVNDEQTEADLEAVMKIPAGTPVIVHSTTAGTYELTKASEGTDMDDVNANELKVSKGDVEGDFDGTTATIYVLNIVNDQLGFYPLNSGKTLAAGKCYIELEEASGAKFIGFDIDDATGISDIATDKMFDGTVYNLSGQRVANPTKGIYIVNGKKVLVK